MKKMDKGLTVPKKDADSWQKKKMSQNIVCPSPKGLDFDEKKAYWASIVQVPSKSAQEYLNR